MRGLGGENPRLPKVQARAYYDDGLRGRVKSSMSRRPSGAGHRRLRSLTGWLLAAIVVLSAVLAASNRPVFWMGWAAILMIFAVVYLVLGARLAPNRPLRLWDQGALLLIIALIPLYGLVQAVPGLGAWVGEFPLLESLQPATISLAPTASLIAALRITSYLVFFSLVLEIAGNADRAERLAWAVFFGVAFHALYGLASLSLFGDQFFWGEKNAYRGFVTGTFINRNAFASFIGMGMCLGFGLTLQRMRREAIRDSTGRHHQMLRLPSIENTALLVLLTLMAITLIRTGSRMGITASGAGLLVVYVTMELKHGIRLRTIGLRIAGGVVALLAIIIPIYGPDLVWRVAFSFADAAYRTTIYTTVVQMITERPILGYGLDAFEPAYEIFRSPGTAAHLVTEYAHSSYLGNWLELGLIVGSLPLIAVGLAAWRLMQITKRRRSRTALPIAALGALCLLALHATIDFSFEMQANVFLLLFLLGLGLAPRNAVNVESM